MEDSARRLSDLLRQHFNQEFSSEGVEFGKLTKAWRRIAGEQCCDHSRVADITKNSVLIYVDHPGWLQKLQFRERHILGQMQREFPDLRIKSLFFRVVSSDEMIGSAVELERKQLQDGIEAQKKKKFAELQAEELKQENKLETKPSKGEQSSKDPEFKKALENLRRAVRG